MEPFGLFQLLNSLLPKPASASEEGGETPPPKEEKTQPPIESPPPAPNACLGFFEAHDRRAKNTRR